MVHALRLMPGQDLRKEIEAYVQAKNMQAGWIATCVGSLTQSHLRFADQPAGVLLHGPFEIVSLAGTVSNNGCHLHLCVSDGLGHTTGGHLLYQNLIYTTAEIIIGESNGLRFMRQKDASTGWNELGIKKRNEEN